MNLKSEYEHRNIRVPSAGTQGFLLFAQKRIEGRSSAQKTGFYSNFYVHAVDVIMKEERGMI